MMNPTTTIPTTEPEALHLDGGFTLCPVCGEPTDEEGTCWQRDCPQGWENIWDQRGCDAYHAAHEYDLEHDR